jgi:hypothetical protein
VKRALIHQNLSIFIPKISEISAKPKSLHESSATYISVLELVHIKIIFVSFSLCCKHFTSLAYEILYARKVDLLDKLKEVNFSQLSGKFRSGQMSLRANVSPGKCYRNAKNMAKSWFFRNSQSLRNFLKTRRIKKIN